MYIETVPNRNSPPAVLLRESYRDGKKVLKRTLANLSDWPTSKIDAFRDVLRGVPLQRPQELFVIERSLPHGHVQAVLGTLRKIGLENMLGTKPSRQRDLVVGMIVERLIFPSSKLAATRQWQSTSLADQLGIADATEDELYAALDWLWERKERIEKKLAAKHLSEGALVFYDVSNSFYYGQHCPLAQYGNAKDKKGLPIIVYGVLTDQAGRPLATDIYAGNTADSSTVPDQVEKVRQAFGLQHVTLVGDRGMLTQTRIDTLRRYPALGWISALRSSAIRELFDQGHLTRSLFDQCNLAEISSPDFPGERLVACHNPLLAAERHRKRQELLAATEKQLARIALAVQRRTKTPFSESQIGLKVGRVVNRFKMAKHFDLRIGAGQFAYSRKIESILQEQQLDGIYVIRTSEPAENLSAEQTVRGYKSLAQVERAFRCLKGLDLLIRPIHHRTATHVQAHIFLCLLAYYVEWHMRQALAPLLFADEQVEAARQTRDAVAPARPSAAAQQKRATHQTTAGLPAHSFRTLLNELGTLCRNTCSLKREQTSQFTQCTAPTPLQAAAFKLLGV